MTANDPHNPSRRRWAPWWAYVLPVVALNYLRIDLVPPDETGDAVAIAFFAVTVAAVAAVVTALHRRV